MPEEVDIGESAGGYRHVLRLAGPMILSTSSWSIMHFLDRRFLAEYSQDSLAASAPAGIASFTALAFFLGTVSYVNTFVAQYCGAGREKRIGPAIWQGIYLALAATVVIWMLYPAAELIMDLGGHETSVRRLEVEYFRILIIGGGLVVLQSALRGFYTGRGRMYVVMTVSMVACGTNAFLDYCWIFGHFGFPRWGIAGAGWATVSAQALGLVIMACLFLAPRNRKRFNTTGQIGLDKELFRRLLRYGAPNGLHWCVDVAAFTFFIFLVGRIGKTELATTNAVFSINHLAFMPMIGLAIATSTLVGQFLGKNRADLAERATSASLRLVLMYMFLIGAVFILLPEPLLRQFQPGDGGADFASMLKLGRALLVFVALYSLTDGVAIVYAAALKGAGDTQFCLIITGILSWSVMALPVYIGVKFFGGGVIMSFGFIMVYIAALAGAFYLRYRGGKWKSMRVIEPEEIPPVGVAEGPLVET